MLNLLHVGCGPQNIQSLKVFDTNEWNEIRLDIDPNVSPDVIGSLTDMSSVGDSSVDAVYSSHNIEHVFPHEVSTVLSEFQRVLKPDGFLILYCPDLLSVSEGIIKNGLEEPLYISPAGPIAPLDVLYGHRPAMERGNIYMAHKCGFTWKTLNQKLHSAGFGMVFGGQFKESFELRTIAFKSIHDESHVHNIAKKYLK